MQIYAGDHAMTYHKFRVPLVTYFHFSLLACYTHFFTYCQYAHHSKLDADRFWELELFLIPTACITY